MLITLITVLAGGPSHAQTEGSTEGSERREGEGGGVGGDRAPAAWLPADPNTASVASVSSDGLVGSEGIIVTLAAPPPADHPLFLTATIESTDTPYSRTIVTVPAGATGQDPTAVNERFSEADGEWVSTPISPSVEISGSALRFALPEARDVGVAVDSLALVISVDENGVVWTSAPIRIVDLSGPDSITCAPWAWVGANPADGRWVPVPVTPGAPALPLLQTQGIIIGFTVPAAPLELNGVGVAGVVDEVLVRPAGAHDAVAPYVLRVDAAAAEVRAFEVGSSEALPVGEPWSAVGAPAAEGVVSFSIDGSQVLDALGVPLDGTSQVAARRTVTFADGRTAVFDSVSLPSPAFAMAATQRKAQEAAAASAAENAAETSDDEDGLSIRTLVVVGLCLLGLGGLLTWEMRDTSWYRHRQERKKYRRAVAESQR